MAVINIATFNTSLSNIETSCSAISTCMSNIGSNFFSAMEGIWNSTRAHQDMTKVLTTVNSLVDSINKSLFSNGGQSAIEALRATANSIAQSELGASVNELSAVTVSEVQLNWSGLEDGYNYPDTDFNLQEFASDTIINELTNVVNELSNINGYMSSIETSLGTSYVGNAISAISSTISKITGEEGIVSIKNEINSMTEACDNERKLKQLEISGE